MSEEMIKIKTFTSMTANKIDELVNEFRKTNKIIAVQTHVVSICETEDVLFVYVVYYK